MGTPFAAIPVGGADLVQSDAARAFVPENICLESDDFIVPASSPIVRRGPSVVFACRIRGCETELALCQDHRLAVRSRRRRQPQQSYVVDLRFVDRELVIERRIAWKSWSVCACLAALAPASYWGTFDAHLAWLRVSDWASLVMLLAAVCTGMLGLCLTRETIELRSTHGRARLVEITGNLGCTRATRTFLDNLVRRIDAIRAGVAQSKPQLLRDEMREHRRLWEAGVLPDADYETSKRRILQAHE